MTIGTLKSPNPRYWTSISLMKSKFLSVSMNTLLAILKVTDARRDVILAGGLYHRFSWRNNPPPRSAQNFIVGGFAARRRRKTSQFEFYGARVHKTTRFSSSNIWYRFFQFKPRKIYPHLAN